MYRSPIIIGITIFKFSFMYSELNPINNPTGIVIAVAVINVGFIVHGPNNILPFNGK